MRSNRLLVAAALLALATAACTRVTDDLVTPPTGTQSPSPSPTGTGAQVQATIYYLIESNGRVFVTPETHTIVESRPGASQLEQMVGEEPQDPDLTSPWPADARVLNVSVEHGTAIVNWSAEVLTASVGAAVERAAIQQAVHTLAALPGIDSVQFAVEGKTAGEASNGRTIEDWWGHVGLAGQPFAPDDDALAPVTITEPSEGATVSGRTLLRGEASTVEANVVIRLLDADGEVLQQTNATASVGGPGRGPWQLRITMLSDPGEYTIEAAEEDLEEGGDFFVTTRTVVVA